MQLYLLDIMYIALWAVIQAFGGPAEHWKRLPSWQEERAMSYMAVVKGATGIQYFLEGIPFSRALWAECRKLALEINALTPAVCREEPESNVKPSSKPQSIDFIRRSQGGSSI